MTNACNSFTSAAGDGEIVYLTKDNEGIIGSSIASLSLFFSIFGSYYIFCS